MDEGLAEATREGLVAGIVELLVAEEDHQMLEQGAPDLGDRRIVEAGRDVDAVDLGASAPAYGETVIS